MAAKYDEHPFSVNLPPDVKLKLRREAAKRGDMTLGGLVRMIIAEWIVRTDKRNRKKKPEVVS